MSRKLACLARLVALWLGVQVLGNATYAQLTTATVVIDNKTPEAAKVRFTQIFGAPPQPPQEFDVMKNEMIRRTISVPLISGATFEVSATIIATGVTSPTSKMTVIEPNDVKIVKLDRYNPSFYILSVTDLVSVLHFVNSMRESGQLDKYLKVYEEATGRVQKEAVNVGELKKLFDQAK